jgi:hypothetical protein
MTKQFLLASSLLALGAISTGCASTAKGVKSSVVNASAPSEKLRADVPDGGVLAVIRYPAVVEDSAKDAYHKAYAKRAIGGTTGRGVTNTVETVAVADSTIVKSNYFALSLYKELAAKLPEHGVLLSPHVIKLGPGGELTSEPMTAAEDLPSVVSVDFATYSFPDSKKMMGNVPLTFGDLVTPLVTVRTDHRAAAPTQGVLMASRPLISRAVAESRELALESIEAMQRGNLEPSIPELDFVSYISNDTPKKVAVQKLATRSDTNSTMILPIEKVRIPKTEMALLKGASDGTVDPLDNIYTDSLSRRIVALINGLDGDKAIMMGKAASVANFDPSLAALTFVGSGKADYAARVAYADRLLDAQRKYLSVQSLRIFDGIHNGELGAQVRDMIAAEHKVLEKRRELAREANREKLAGIGAAIAGGLIATQGGGGSRRSAQVQQCEQIGRSRGRLAYQNCMERLQDVSQRVRQQCRIRARSGSSDAYRRCVQQNDPLVSRSSGNVQIGNALLSAGLFSLTDNTKTRLSQQIGSNYLNSIVPALEQQTTVTVDLLDSNETITAIRYEDLQTKLQDLYSSRQRSLDTVATQCAYVDAGQAKRGTWLGVCENGVANGSGAGVLEAGEDVMEYFGYARNGMAEGAGLMIRHTPLGSVSYEGNFVNGQPDGAVRVSQSGREDKIRTYVAGIDKGESSQKPASPFQGQNFGGVN